MLDLFFFLLLTASLSIVHVFVSPQPRRTKSVINEISRHFVSIAGLILILAVIIKGVSAVFQ